MAVAVDQQRTIWGWLVQPLLDPTPERLVLAQPLDWETIAPAWRPFDNPRGRDAKPIRLMVGLHLLQHRDNVAAEPLVQGRHAHLDWMACCGIEVGMVLEQAKPGKPFRGVEPSTLRKWRRRLGVPATRVLAGVVPQQWARAPVRRAHTMVLDTTARAKHLASPTATTLLDNGRRQLLQLIGRAQALGVAVPPGRRRSQGCAGDPLHVSWTVLAWHTKKWGRRLQPRLLPEPQAHRQAA